MGGGGNKRRTNSEKNSGGNNRGRRTTGVPRAKTNYSSFNRNRSSLFVEGGLLSDWQLDPRGRNARGKVNSGSKSDQGKASSVNGSRRLGGNAIGYSYPYLDLQEDFAPESSIEGGGSDGKMNNMHPIILLGSRKTQVVAYMDETPPQKQKGVDYVVGYSSDFVLGDSSHRGLGFDDECEATPSGVGSSSKQIEEQSVSFEFSSSDKEVETDEKNVCESGELVEEFLLEEPKKNSGFLSIGGVKLYTEDLSDEEIDEDYDGRSLDDEDSEMSDQGGLDGTSENSDSEATSDSDSSAIDDEVAQDYLEGIGGSDSMLDAKWLLGQAMDESDDDGSPSSSFDETIEKLGGIALQEESRQYGLRKSRSKKKSSEGARDSWTPTLDDVMFVKDPRTISGKKRRGAQFSQSWHSELQKSKTSRKFPGERKKHRKEMIAVKRHERMKRRGLDLEQINSKLEQIVLDGADIYAFQPMLHRDCSQVRRLAAIYRLSSGCHGSGKKKFVTVERTRHTCMPSSSDKARLEKLLGGGNEDADFIVNGQPDGNSLAVDRGSKKKAAEGSSLSLLELQQSAQSKKASRFNASGSTKKKRGEKKGSYANLPVSFVSRGVIHSDSDIVEVSTSHSEVVVGSSSKEKTPSSAQIGAFEVHTRGFGSKMMAKMGYVEGGGLGRDGQGIAAPIEVTKRPKSLGLGVNFTNDTADVVKMESSGSSGKTQPRTYGSFEKHTKGFGSKMMAKMGFVEGSGLGKDAQGMVNPLVAVRLPKSRGLGAKG